MTKHTWQNAVNKLFEKYSPLKLLKSHNFPKIRKKVKTPANPNHQRWPSRVNMLQLIPATKAHHLHNLVDNDVKPHGGFSITKSSWIPIIKKHKQGQENNGRKGQNFKNSSNKPFKKLYIPEEDFEKLIDESKDLHDEADKKQPDSSKQNEYLSEVILPSLGEMHQENDKPLGKHNSFRKGIKKKKEKHKIELNSESSASNLPMTFSTLQKQVKSKENLLFSPNENVLRSEFPQFLFPTQESQPIESWSQQTLSLPETKEGTSLSVSATQNHQQLPQIARPRFLLLDPEDQVVQPVFKTENKSKEQVQSSVSAAKSSKIDSPLFLSEISGILATPTPDEKTTSFPTLFNSFSAPEQQQLGRKNSVVNHQWNGQNFHISWSVGVRNLSWDKGNQYCLDMGMKIISLDYTDKVNHFMKQVR